MLRAQQGPSPAARLGALAAGPPARHVHRSAAVLALQMCSLLPVQRLLVVQQLLLGLHGRRSGQGCTHAPAFRLLTRLGVVGFGHFNLCIRKAGVMQDCMRVCLGRLWTRPSFVRAHPSVGRRAPVIGAARLIPQVLRTPRGQHERREHRHTAVLVPVQRAWGHCKPCWAAT